MPAATVIRNGVIASACGLALCIAPAMAGATPAPSQTSFSFTGSVTGMLSGPNTPCSQQVVTAKGATFMLNGTLKGAPATQWTIQLYAPKAGSWKNFAQANGEGPNVALIGAEANGTTNWNWASETKNGTMATTHTSGKVSITLVGYSSFRGKPGKGKVHMTGAWGCTP